MNSELLGQPKTSPILKSCYKKIPHRITYNDFDFLAQSLTFPSSGSNTNLAFLTSMASHLRTKKCTQISTRGELLKFDQILVQMPGMAIWVVNFPREGGIQNKLDFLLKINNTHRKLEYFLNRKSPDL